MSYIFGSWPINFKLISCHQEATVPPYGTIFINIARTSSYYELRKQQYPLTSGGGKGGGGYVEVLSYGRKLSREEEVRKSLPEST